PPEMDASPSAPVATALTPLRHPPSALTELGVLTDRSEGGLAPILDPTALPTLVLPALCGDEEACATVRSAILDDHTTTLQVVPASSWNLAEGDVEASAATLSQAARASIRRRTHIVVVHVATGTSSRQLA